MTAGSFSVLESRATRAPDVVYLENKTRVFFIDSEAEVHRYTPGVRPAQRHGARPGASPSSSSARIAADALSQAAPEGVGHPVVRRGVVRCRLCRSSVRASARRAQPLAGASSTSRVSASSALASCAEPK